MPSAGLEPSVSRSQQKEGTVCGQSESLHSLRAHVLSTQRRTHRKYTVEKTRQECTLRGTVRPDHKARQREMTVWGRKACIAKHRTRLGWLFVLLRVSPLIELSRASNLSIWSKRNL